MQHPPDFLEPFFPSWWVREMNGRELKPNGPGSVRGWRGFSPEGRFLETAPYSKGLLPLFVLSHSWQRGGRVSVCPEAFRPKGTGDAPRCCCIWPCLRPRSCSSSLPACWHRAPRLRAPNAELRWGWGRSSPQGVSWGSVGPTRAGVGARTAAGCGAEPQRCGEAGRCEPWGGRARGRGVPELSGPCSWAARLLGGCRTPQAGLLPQEGVFKDPFPFFSGTSLRLY